MRTSDHAGFGIPGIDAGEAIEQAQRYWQAWGDALRSAASGGAPASQDVWQSALERWTQFAGTAMGASAQRDPIDRFANQAQQWFGTMQDVASQFVGRNASAGDVVDAWRRAMGGNAENPFAAMFSQMSGRGQSGFDQWYEQVAPFMQQVFSGGAGADASQFASRMFGGGRDEARRWLQMPSFGLAREHQERWQALAQAQLDLQEANDGYNALMARAGRDAFERFERKLAERAEPGRQLQSARALFDLWIDAAEEAYAEIALSSEFRTHYAALVNAQMRVRAGVQREVETIGGLFGMPTRTEVDGAHRKIAELERELRRLRKSIDGASTAARTPLQSAARTATEKLAATVAAIAKKATASAKPVAKVDDAQAYVKAAKTRSTGAKKRASKKAVSKKSVSKKEASKKTALKKETSKKSASKKTASRTATSKLSANAKKPSRSPAHSAVKRGARPSIAMAIPLAPQPMAATKRPASTNRKR